jgi:hypothetical protein
MINHTSMQNRNTKILFYYETKSHIFLEIYKCGTHIYTSVIFLAQITQYFQLLFCTFVIYFTGYIAVCFQNLLKLMNIFFI